MDSKSGSSSSTGRSVRAAAKKTKSLPETGVSSDGKETFLGVKDFYTLTCDELERKKKLLQETLKESGERREGYESKLDAADSQLRKMVQDLDAKMDWQKTQLPSNFLWFYRNQFAKIKSSIDDKMSNKNGVRVECDVQRPTQRLLNIVTCQICRLKKREEREREKKEQEAEKKELLDRIKALESKLSPAVMPENDQDLSEEQMQAELQRIKEEKEEVQRKLEAVKEATKERKKKLQEELARERSELNQLKIDLQKAEAATPSRKQRGQGDENDKGLDSGAKLPAQGETGAPAKLPAQSSTGAVTKLPAQGTTGAVTKLPAQGTSGAAAKLPAEGDTGGPTKRPAQGDTDDTAMPATKKAK